MKEFLKELKPDDLVVRELHGGGYVSESLVKIDSILDNGIFIDGVDGDYADDSVYRFSLINGRSCNNYMVGFYSVLTRLATEKDLEDLEID